MQSANVHPYTHAENHGHQQNSAWVQESVSVVHIKGLGPLLEQIASSERYTYHAYQQMTVKDVKSGVVYCMWVFREYKELW